MRNRQFVFTSKIEYKLAAERSEANPSCLQFPVWWSILKIVRTHFAACGGEGLAKNSACPPEAFGEGGNRNPELKNCQRT